MNRSCFLLIVLCTCQFALADNVRHSRSLLDDEESCKTPRKPKSSRMSCDTVLPHQLECHVKCKKGYVLESGFREKTYFCDGYEGGWREYPSSDCYKVCHPVCENEGKCYEGHCVCPPEYRGKTCQYPISLCENKGFESYLMNCNHTSSKSFCTASCPDGMQFVSLPEDVYECSLDGTWTTNSPPGCEPMNVIYPAGKESDLYSSMRTGEAMLPRSSGVCAAWGRYHYRTFDGKIFSFDSSCTYLLAKDCLSNSFDIHVSVNPECDMGTYCTRKVIIYTADEKYEVEKRMRNIVVMYGGKEIDLPGTSGSLQFEWLAQYLVISSNLGFSLKWDGKQAILLSLKDSLKNKTCGLCGQYDGTALNDFEILGSDKVKSHAMAFADAWKMTKLGETCVLRNHMGCTYKTSEETAIAEAAATACYAIYDDAYNACHKILEPKQYFDACKIEFCGCERQDISCICDTLAEYFRECVRLGGKIHGGWRRDICPLDCPHGMEYTDCGSSCPKTCKQIEYECDNEHCVDGCHCHTGMHFHNGECIPVAKCPCVHGDSVFSPGEKIINDCNQCECLGGKWECTEKICQSRCTSTGDAHYKTFDGYKYQFKGDCSYYLVYHKNFTIIQDSSSCTDSGLSKKPSFCKKSVIIDAYSTNIVFKYDMEVTVNRQDINKFPFINKDIKLQKTSSAILLDIINGVSLTWDGTNSIFIDAPASLIGTTQGLCGTYNHKIRDDFSTPDGAIEAQVDDFAEKWKTSIECKEQYTLLELDDPCAMYKEKEVDAHRLCNVLKSNVFKGCHSEEDVNPFYKDCLYDMCTCQKEIKDCLCPVLSNYAAACTKKGFPILWRQEIKECEIECIGGQTYQKCANPCEYSCKSLSLEECDKKCVEGCACSEGTALAPDGVCIPISQCPCFHHEKEYTAGSIRNLNSQLICECSNGHWKCNASIGTESEMMGIEAVSCQEEKNMVFSVCIKCLKTCQNYLLHTNCETSICRSGCSCMEGYVLDTDSDSCVKIEDCGCWHGGNRFPEGSTHMRDCNNCICLKGIWECENKDCPGTCNSWGEIHVKTFDGNNFDFQGACEYILVKGTTSDGTIFQIVMETKICGSNGITCSKGIKLQLGDEVKLLSHNEDLPKPSYDSPFTVRKVGLLVYIYLKLGVIVVWDRGTRITIHAEPKWKGKLSGLCGDFNDDQADDFKTPANGPVEAQPRYFVDSWKLNAACPFPETIKDSCAINSQRKSWAKTRCSVLKSDLFKPCHKFVPVDPFYERCVFDACGCDFGGDCECLCAALAAYSEQCGIQGISIAWRSQDLCPIQCVDCGKYMPCMSTCPKETCETKFMYSDIKKVCNNIPCAEGCEPEPCPSGQIYNNERDFKCIPEIDCEVPCKEINGKVYVEGERITDYSIVDACQTCHCQRGKIACTGKSCRNKTFCGSTGWSQWMNSPSTAYGDYERLADPTLQRIYFEACTPEYITEIQCQTTYTNIPSEYAGQKVICELPDGLICNDKDQENGQCNDYEIRVFCQCEFSTEGTTVTSTEITPTENKCVAPGWTAWMKVNVSTSTEEEELIDKLRKYYTFCPEDEIEKAECRISASKVKSGFGENVKCTKNGMDCISGLKGKRCRNYEIRFYCRCEGTACAHKRGMETGIISDSQITAKSVLQKGITESYYARLNGNQAWTAKSQSQLEWIQVDLDEIQQVTGVITQGNPNVLQWVEKYTVYYSIDGFEFANVFDSNGNLMVFIGNNDQNTEVTNFFPSPVRARYVRIYPFKWNGAVTLRLELLGCNVYVSTSAVTPSTTSHFCIPGWTDFINTDSPRIGEEDYEKVEDIVKTYGICTEGKISDIECKAFVDGERVHFNSTGDFGVVCKTSVGLYCSNYQQSLGRQCKDYSIRLYCSCENIVVPSTTTSVPGNITRIPQVCGWTDWINIDKPKAYKGDKGDMESLDILQNYYGLCRKPELTYLECRVASTHYDWIMSYQNELICDTDVGFVCYNRAQASACYDYEVRAYCQYDWCPMPSTISTMPSTISSTVPTTGPCSPNEYFDDCAYKCEEVCLGYLSKLYEVGKCQGEDNNCIATCRPKINCDYPLVWRDPYTCVERSECTCVLPNGIEIEPRIVVNNSICEHCECLDNHLNCWTVEACRSSLLPVAQSVSTPVTFNLSTVTPGPCSPNEYYDVCAYKCDQICLGYLSKLHAVGKCLEEGDDCVATCRPKINCEYPFVWKDPYTCVEKSECTCFITSGREIEPGEIASNGPCESCECYENKLNCMTDEACSSTTTSLGLNFSTETTSPCSPGEYYDDCAYKCNQVCLGYLYKLHAIGKCQNGGDNCIATCRPNHNCDYPLLWKDPFTCVEKSECTCVLSSGTEIEPREVASNSICESCECLENSLNCWTKEACRSTSSPVTLSTKEPGLCFDGTRQKFFDIAIEQITVSSQGLLSGKDRIYLNTTSSNKGTGGWLPNAADRNQFVQIDFGHPQYVSAITTQGENGYENWVTKYTVSFSSDGIEWEDIRDEHHSKVFSGNYDSDTPVTNTLENMIKVRYIFIIPVEWHNWITMRLGVQGCPYLFAETTLVTFEVKNHTAVTPSPIECSMAMLYPKEEVSTSVITVSSVESEFSGINRIKIDTIGGPDGTGGWKSAVNDKDQFVLVSFPENRNLSGIITQGQEDEANWVTSYIIEYSTDNINWHSISDKETGHIFRGNSDRNSVATRWFKEITMAHYVKIKPITFHGAIAMRLEILGCYEVSTEISVSKSTLPPISYCPELPASSRENCPYCTSEFVCDGRNCISHADCPCYMEGGKYKAGSKYETSDCQECVCTMFGRSLCVKKKCVFCPLDQKSVLTEDCQCECEECPKGSVYCPSDNLCIDENKWCDGKIDCTDDEVDCEYTTSTVVITPTTIRPKMCIPTLNESIATCELDTGFVNTFDGSTYELDVCDHVLFREKYLQMYVVKVHMECSETTGVCGRYIVIDIDNFIIKIGPGPNKIEFNGIEVPKTHLHLLSKRFKSFAIRNEGTFLTFVSFKYGFKLIWDTHYNVKIKVSDCLLTEVNGLCGFYDGIKENDFSKPDGTIAQTVDSFTRSWSINSSDHCIQLVCNSYMKLAAEHICSSIEESIFEDCNHVLDMEREKDICLALACECLANNFTSSDCTCQILENFLHSCEEKMEVTNNAWRVEFSCVPKCPPGLEWNDCGPSCELTCNNFRDRNLDCPKKCTPGCFCPTGLVRKGERCVDAKLCHDCVCTGYGDPNFQTFDHQSYAFQGNCTYTLVQHPSDYNPDLEIFVTNTECPLEPGTTCATELKLVYNNNIIIITRNHPVKFNQQILEDVVYNFYKNGINVTAAKEHVVVYIAEINLLVHYMVPNYGFAIKLPSKLYYNETVGLCGICNFDPYDDYYHRDGYVTGDLNDFVYSWLVDSSRETCTLIEIPPSPPGDLCKFIKESECEIYVDPTPYIKACENDVSYSLNVNSSICKTILQYATSCCEYGVILDDWIKSFGCEIQCPQGMIYQCKSLCHLTCSNYKEHEVDCDIEPEYLCSCPGDLVFKDGECVDPIYCVACDDEGHMVGQHWNVNLCESCECLPNLKVVCQNIKCSTATSCPEGTTLHMISNGTCCDEYVCQTEVTTACPPPSVIPSCQTGARLQLITTNKCPEYQCECDLSLCKPLNNISHLEPGEEDDVQQNGCCLEQIVRCVPENCPPQRICDIGSKLIENEGKCCTLYDCVSVEKCVYKHHLESLEGFGSGFSESEEIIKLYEPGETWKDGSCTTCRCEKEGEKYVYYCETIKCAEPSYVSNPKDYIYEQKEVSGSCCPEYVRTACESNGTTYQVGDEWPLSYGDKCNSYKCIIGEQGEIKKALNTITCNKNCPAYAEYVEPPLESLHCCGNCVSFGCEDHGKIYMVGDKWIPHSNKCIQAECVKHDGKIEKVLTGKQCPLVPAFCPDEHKITDESGCCKLCRIEPGACEVKHVPSENSTFYFNLNDKVHGVCFNTEPIKDLTECSGSCQSKIVYLSSLGIFTNKCHCCTARESVTRHITLRCYKDNSTIVKEYKQPRVCECTSCSEQEKESSYFELKAPKSVK